MKLIAEKKGPRDKADLLRFVRRDGSTSQCALPRQGTLPHDLIHYVVESRLPFRNGFLGLIAAGSAAEFVVQIVHDVKAADVEREAVQVEAIVEALQTQLWAGAFDAASFLDAARLAANSRGTPPFDFGSTDPRALYDACLQLLERWNAVPHFAALELELPGGGEQAVAMPARRGGARC